MHCDLKKILLTTCCLTLSACGGSGLGPVFTVDPTTADDGYNALTINKSATFKASSVVLEYIDHPVYNNEALYPLYAYFDLDDQVAGSEANPSHVAATGNATMQYDASDGSFNLSVDQGNVSFFHNFLESERDLTVTDRMHYMSILGDNLYQLDISQPGTSSWGHAALSYMSYGMWSARAYPVNVSAWERIVYGGVAFGDETKSADMPISGSASYSGGTVGQYDRHYRGEVLDQAAYDTASAEAAAAGLPAPNIADFTIKVNFHNTFSLTGDVAIDVNFSANSLRADFMNMEQTDEDGVASLVPWLDFHSSLALTPGSSTFEGITSTDTPYLHGTIMGAFYGPTSNGGPAEVGGIWSLFDGGQQTIRVIGSFGAKRD